ncbi:g1470 [Coccomyxa elongata]
MQEQIPQESFDWARQWYALSFVNYLDPKVPHPKELLGVRLVLWRDAEGAWRCFEDKCPHRLAPLSEGRIEPSNGTLMCSYHGWQFNGEGKCTAIPQSLDAKANAAACSNPRSCAKARPTKVVQNMIFVWGGSGPNAAADAAAMPVPVIPDLEVVEGMPTATTGGHSIVPNFTPYYRELPYGFEVLAENLTDPSHLPFAHHGVLNKRDDDKAGYFHMSIRDNEGGVDQDVVSASAESVRPIVGDLQQRRFEFRPPGQIRWHTYFSNKPESGEPFLNLLSFHLVPNGPGRSSVLFYGFFVKKAFDALPSNIRFRLRWRPKWWSHTFTHNIFDGDSKILYIQERFLAEENESGLSMWRRAFYMPAQADRLVAGFRKWLDVRGGGGPPVRLINRADQPLPAYDDRQNRLLNRYNLHTRHCPYCLGAVRGFKLLQTVSASLGALCMLALSAALGRGLPFVSPAPIISLAGAVASFVGWKVATEVSRRFHFVGYNHSEK